jgi:hypothetical protein
MTAWLIKIKLLGFRIKFKSLRKKIRGTLQKQAQNYWLTGSPS